MGRRSYTRNAYETQLDSPLSISASEMTVLSAAGLTAPVYLVIDPDIINGVNKREWVKVSSIQGNTLTLEFRGLTGSVDPLQVHDSDAPVRAIYTSQVQDDLFQDIKDLEDVVGDLPTDYLKLDGTNAMAAPLSLLPTAPALDSEATNKKYVDDEAQAAEDAATSYADGLDHDHATPIATHDSAAGAHGAKSNTNPHNHNRYTDSEAASAIGTPWEGQYLPLAGNAVSASKWKTARTITVALSGDLTGSAGVAVDGAANKTISLVGTVKNDSHTHDTQYFTEAQTTAGFISKSGETINDNTKPYGCDVYSAATQSIPDGAWTLLGMDSERYDPHNDFDRTAGNEKYVIPVQGLYMFGASCRMDTSSGNISDYRVQVEHSSGAAYESWADPASSGPALTVFAIRYCNVGETLRARVYQKTGSSKLTKANTQRFWAARIA